MVWIRLGLTMLEVEKEILCYTCAKKFTKVHHFYDKLCPPCADLNYKKRNQKADLTGNYCCIHCNMHKGKIALVTGGRIKIGYEIVLILLRCGATVITTTRFPKDASLRFSKEKDFDQWKDRLQIYGLDFRYLPSVIEFAEFLKRKLPRLDIIINNAAQTVRKPPAYYSHLLKIETKPLKEFEKDIQHILPGDYSMKIESVKAIASGTDTTKSLTTIPPDISVSAGKKTESGLITLKHFHKFQWEKRILMYRPRNSRKISWMLTKNKLIYEPRILGHINYVRFVLLYFLVYCSFTGSTL